LIRAVTNLAIISSASVGPAATGTGNFARAKTARAALNFVGGVHSSTTRRARPVL
jgi:hypothetical protein